MKHNHRNPIKFIPKTVLWLSLVLLITGCVIADEHPAPDDTTNSSATMSMPASHTPVPSPTLLSSPTLTVTSSPIPTLVPSYTSTPSPTHNPTNLTCRTPMSLMLHSAFGAERMHELADAIIRRGFHTITYQDLYEMWLSGICPDEKTIVVSLDDLGTDWLRPDFRQIIAAFTERGLVLTVGVVVHGEQNPEIWEYLRTLEEKGVEIASHTIDHYDLAQISATEIERQVAGSHQIICDYLKHCPVSLILPFGKLDADGITLETSRGRYVFLIGIAGGETYGGKEPPFYVGRVPPDNNSQETTLNILSNSFLVPSP